MIKTEFYRERTNGVKLYITYSDAGMLIQKDGTEDEIYAKAIDIENSGFTYTETDIPIEGETDDEQAQKAAAFDYLTGRSGDADE